MKSIRSVTQATVRKPRLHDLRHHFAISILTSWYQNGQEVERCLPTLLAYLGHVETRETYWYLSACPELMGQKNHVWNNIGGIHHESEYTISTVIDSFFY